MRRIETVHLLILRHISSAKYRAMHFDTVTVCRYDFSIWPEMSIWKTLNFLQLLRNKQHLRCLNSYCSVYTTTVYIFLVIFFWFTVIHLSIWPYCAVHVCLLVSLVERRCYHRKYRTLIGLPFIYSDIAVWMCVFFRVAMSVGTDIVIMHLIESLPFNPHFVLSISIFHSIDRWIQHCYPIKYNIQFAISASNFPSFGTFSVRKEIQFAKTNRFQWNIQFVAPRICPAAQAIENIPYII